MKITAIKSQVKNPERVSVYVDKTFAFSLNHAQLLEQKLYTGLEVDQPRLNELKKASDLGKTYERALNYVMIRPRSEREVRDYARRKKWEAEITGAVVSKLLTRNYLNDHAFAKAWVESRRLTKPTSTRKLRLELKQKGVADDIVQEVLAGSDDINALRTLIAKKRKLARYANDQQKFMQYLARQGFGFNDIKTALGQDEEDGDYPLMYCK